MTEEEAKGKWCPFARMITGTIDEKGRSEHPSNATAYNRIVDGGRWSFSAGGGCIGSACMAWRKNRDPDRIRAGISEYGGHCGLAGEP